MNSATRLSALYGGLFLFIGINMPFWPVWLEAKGLSASEIGIALATGSLLRMFFSPTVARICDRTGERKRPLIIVSALSFIVFLPFAIADDFWTILLLQALFTAISGPIMPLTEAITMLGAKRKDLNYGRIRLWGSITFIVGASGVGFFLKGAAPDVIWFALISALGVLVVTTLTLPDFRTAGGGKDIAPFSDVLRDRTFLAFIAATMCIQGSHALLYGFGTLNWLRIGLDPDVIGMLWAEGVIAEVILFVYGANAIRRIGPAHMIALAGLACAIRWGLTGVTENLFAIAALQVLHAFTFGAAHLGAVFFIAERMPEEVSATAQTLYALMVNGVGIGLTSLLAGHLYENFAGHAFLAMAVMGTVGMVIAWQIRRR